MIKNGTTWYPGDRVEYADDNENVFTGYIMGDTTTSDTDVWVQFDDARHLPDTGVVGYCGHSGCKAVHAVLVDVRKLTRIAE